MKVFILALLLLQLSSAFASWEDCLKDAASYANHNHPITPASTCFDDMKVQSEHLSVTGTQYKVYGLGHMIYVEHLDTGGVLISRDLLAGDQTQLKSLKKLILNEGKNRLLVIQEGENGDELLTYKLDFIGNVSPVTKLDSDVVNGATSALLSDSVDEISVSFSAMGKMRTYSSEADSRYKDQQAKYNPVILREESIP